MGAVRLAGIEKIFPGGHVAVAGVDLEVATSELVVLLGPSGCGKSTLLRIVAGIEVPTRGRVFIDEHDVTDLPARQRDIAMVFQSYALYPHMSVRDNIGFGLKMRGAEKSAVAARVATVAESLGIETLLDRKPAQLSGGQRQRVALGRAVAREAKVFLLDEPLSNLDVQLRVSTRSELARLHHKLAVPMLYVTHDQEEAMTLGDRVAVLRAGRVLQVGAPREIYARPATQFVAGFVGSPRMNFVPGMLSSENGGRPRVDFLGCRLDIPVAKPANSMASCPVVVGIRPEDLQVVAPSMGHVVVTTDVIESLGRETVAHVLARATEGGPVQELRVLTADERDLRVGAPVGLRFRGDRLHLFDPDTEARVEVNGL
jgi:multiple sugar transport system ATP-binding protein